MSFLADLRAFEASLANTVNVATSNGLLPVKGQAVDGVPGLLVTESLDGRGWTITHVLTGEAITSNVMSKAEAVELVRDLGLFPIDWTVKPDGLGRQLARLGDVGYELLTLLGYDDKE